MKTVGWTAARAGRGVASMNCVTYSIMQIKSYFKKGILFGEGTAAVVVEKCI